MKASPLEVFTSPFLDTVEGQSYMVINDTLLALKRSCFKAVFFTTKNRLVRSAGTGISYSFLEFVGKDGGLDVILFLCKCLHHD
jgi:hypothetical protein